MVEGLSPFYSSAMNRDWDFSLMIAISGLFSNQQMGPKYAWKNDATCTSCSSLHSLGGTIDAGYIWVGNLTFKEALLDSLLTSIPHLSTCITIWFLISYLINRIPILQIHNKTGYRYMLDCLVVYTYYFTTDFPAYSDIGYSDTFWSLKWPIL